MVIVFPLLKEFYPDNEDGEEEIKRKKIRKRQRRR
jgi:hypothetical protein